MPILYSLVFYHFFMKESLKKDLKLISILILGILIIFFVYWTHIFIVSISIFFFLLIFMLYKVYSWSKFSNIYLFMFKYFVLFIWLIAAYWFQNGSCYWDCWIWTWLVQVWWIFFSFFISFILFFILNRWYQVRTKKNVLYNIIIILVLYIYLWILFWMLDYEKNSWKLSIAIIFILISSLETFYIIDANNKKNW